MLAASINGDDSQTRIIIVLGPQSKLLASARNKSKNPNKYSWPELGKVSIPAPSNRKKGRVLQPSLTFMNSFFVTIPNMKRKIAHGKFKRFIKDVSEHTPFAKMVIVLIALWLIFSAGFYFAEHGAEGTTISSFGNALYWGIAAFSTAGIADTPKSGVAQLIGGIWIVTGSMLFFGIIVATITAYFMRPMQRPHKKIIETIEYNLEQLNDLTIDELDLLKETVDTLISHVEHLKKKQRN